MDKQILTEDKFVNWIHQCNGILMTRKVFNFDQNNKSTFENCKIVCLTGYDSIVAYFFDKMIDNFMHKIILITLETDGFNMKIEYINHPKLFHWFTWNKSIDHKKITCIPIGLNADRHEKSLNQFLKNKNDIVRNKLFAVNLSTHSNASRKDFIELAQTEWKGFCTLINNIPFVQTYWQHSYIEKKIKIDVTSSKCYKIMSEFKFILSPPGAGFDCHRTWEALYVGTIPIIIKSSINEIFDDLPVLIVDNWNIITRDFLEEKYNEIRAKIDNNEYNMETLYFQYWIDLINDKIKENI